MRRWPYTVLAYVCVGLALIGVVLPGLPTVPFLLVAVWDGTRGSTWLHNWLETHPQFGPPLRAWRNQGSISRRAKWSAVIMLLSSWGLLTWHTQALWVAMGAGLLFAGVAVFLLSRPVPTDDRTAPR